MTISNLLTQMGFGADENGALAARAQVVIVPVNNMFFEVRITATGGAISVVVHKTAIKVTPAAAAAAIAADNR
jgi:hypothetical protein